MGYFPLSMLKHWLKCITIIKLGRRALLVSLVWNSWHSCAVTVLDHFSHVTDRTAQNHAEYHAKDLEEKGCDLGIHLQNNYNTICTSIWRSLWQSSDCFYHQTPKHQTINMEEVSLILSAHTDFCSLFWMSRQAQLPQILTLLSPI